MPPSPLDRILEVSLRLAASADLREILLLIIDAMRDALDAERATVFEHHAATAELATTVAHGVGDKLDDGREGVREIRLPLTAGLAGECARTRRMIRVDDAYADSRFNPEVDQRTGFRTRSILTIPLIDHDDDLVGVAQVLNKRAGPFGPDDERLAEALAAHAAVALRRGRLIEDRLHRLRLEQEVEVARLIQQTSFPAQIPQPEGFEIAAWNQPATETGGDVYDVIASAGNSDRVVILMADATGHGVGPAISVTQLRSMLRMAVRLGADLSSIAQHVNAQLCQDLPAGRFITAWIGELDAHRWQLRSFSAGQAPLLLCRAATGETESIPADTVPFGILDELHTEVEVTIDLQPGDVFAVFSDGIFEGRNAADEQFGMERTTKLLRDAVKSNRSAAQIIEHLQRELAAYAGDRPADDDRTAIVIRRKSA